MIEWLSGLSDGSAFMLVVTFPWIVLAAAVLIRWILGGRA